MNFGQLTKYNMRKFFFKDHTQNVMEKLFSDSFPQNQNLSLWISSPDFCSVHYYICQAEGYRNILKLNSKPLASISCKANKQQINGDSKGPFLYNLSSQLRIYPQKIRIKKI